MSAPALPVRFGLIGAGGISRRHRDGFVARPDLARLVAVCDARPEVAQTFADSLPEPADVYTDHRRLLESGTIDAAIVALPHFLHASVATDVVETGIPVLVEKPLTCTLDETRKLRDLAAARGVSVVAGQMRRFNREAVWLRRWLDADPRHFGALRSFDIHSWQNLVGYLVGVLGLPPGGDHWLLDGKRAGGGVVISLAVHQLDLVRFVTGHDYAEVMAHGRFDAPFYNGAESSAVVLLRMDNGAAGALHANYLTPRTPYNEAMHLFGEHGTIVQHADAIGQYHGPLRFASAVPGGMTTWAQMYESLVLVPAHEVADLDDDPFVNQLAAFALALHEGRKPANHVDDNFNTMACVQAITDSLRSGKPAPVAAQ
jgi:predicted dehydrogenase